MIDDDVEMSGFLCLFISFLGGIVKAFFWCLFSVALRYTTSPRCRGHWGQGRGLGPNCNPHGMGASVRLDSADVKLYKSAGAVRE